MASYKLCSQAIVCSLLILHAFIGSTQSASCCLMYSRRPVRSQQITGYTLQTINASCDITAVIFHTRSRFVCADPSKSWTIKGIKYVDARMGRAQK